MQKAEITADVVTCLLREQVPHLAHLPVTPMAVDGWDNSSFRVGTGHTARLPSADGYAPAVAKEHRWLPVLAHHLPVPIPEPVVRGVPGCGFPRPWSVYRWIPGDPATRDRVADLDTFARDLAVFLTALWGVDTAGGPPAGTHSAGRGGPLAVHDLDVLSSIHALPPGVDATSVQDVWRAATASRHADPPRWFHGDMAPSNILTQDGRMSAVIDFGTCGVGDPACDLVIAWTFLDLDARRTFTRHADVDPDTWDRARGWALWKALLTLRERDHDATVHRYGWRYSALDVIQNVVTDHGS